MVREAVLERHVMAKRAGILVESGFFTRFWNINYFLRLTSLGSNNKAFVQRSHLQATYKKMVVGVLFWHDNNRQTTIALTIRILSYNPICFNTRHSGQCSATVILVT